MPSAPNIVSGTSLPRDGSGASLLAEYEQLCENIRHYSNMRFAQLTLYFALTGGLVAFLSGPDAPPHSTIRLLFLTAGAVSAGAFGVMEERATAYWHHFLQRAEELEKPLGFSQFTTRPKTRIFKATYACRVLIWGGASVWSVVALVELACRCLTSA